MLHLKTHKIILALACVLAFGASQGQQIFQKEYYGREVKAPILENESGYFFGGFKAVNFSDFQGYFYHVDSLGNVIWAKHYGLSYPNQEFFWTYSFNSDTTAILIGGYRDPDGTNLINQQLLVCIDMNGNTLWSRIQGDTLQNRILGLCAADTNYFLAGYVGNHRDTLNIDARAYLLKVDPQGNTISQKFFGTNGTAIVYTTAVVQHGTSVFVSGVYVDYNSMKSDGLLMKLDANLNVIWAKKFGNSLNFSASYILFNAAGNLLVSGRMYSSGSFQNYHCQFDQDGNLIWAKMLDTGGINSNNGPTIDVNGNYMLSLTPSTIVKCDSAMNVLNARNFSTGFINSLSVASPTKDGGAIAGGSIYSSFNTFVVKLDSSFNGVCNQYTPNIVTLPLSFSVDSIEVIDIPSGINTYNNNIPSQNIFNNPVTHCATATSVLSVHASVEIFVYPNPADEYFEIKVNKKSALNKISVVNSIGQTLDIDFTKNIPIDNTYKVKIVSKIPGLYFLKCQFDDNTIYSTKIILK